MGTRRWLLGGLLVWGASTGCEPVSPTVGDVHYPEGFAFETHERVRLQVDPAGLDPRRVQLRIALPDGQPLFVGSAALAQQRAPRLQVPGPTTELEAAVVYPDGTADAWLFPVAGDRASLVLDGGS